MDPFTAFAAAGNVLQFTELGINLIKKTIEYSRDGGSSEHQRLQDVVQRLMVSSAHLHQSLHDEVDEAPELGTNATESYRTKPGPKLALHLANNECLRVSGELCALLSSLKLDKYRSAWRSSK